MRIHFISDYSLPYAIEDNDLDSRPKKYVLSVEEFIASHSIDPTSFENEYTEHYDCGEIIDVCQITGFQVYACEVLAEIEISDCVSYAVIPYASNIAYADHEHLTYSRRLVDNDPREMLCDLNQESIQKIGIATVNNNRYFTCGDNWYLNVFTATDEYAVNNLDREHYIF